jgi:succinate-semialdehyde dehydrogenase / glutarate-semialdehyde dehydrogenase
MPFVAIDPSTAETLYTVEALDAAARETLLDRVHQQQRRWRDTTLAERGVFVTALAAALRRHRERLAMALTTEMGKPIAAARAEVDKCVALCEQAPALAARALATETLIDDATAVVTLRYEPLGTVLAIMPWNFPYWQALRFAVPAVLAGNGVLIKPAASVPGSARGLQQCFDEAAAASETATAPCAVAFVEHEDIDTWIADARIVGVTLTGSDRAGRHVAAQAGAHLKKVVLELGGSDPFIVLADADVERAAASAVSARTVNSGQSCIAAKRFIVVDAVYDAFMDRFLRGMRSLRMGDPRDERTQIGPIATQSVWESLAAQVQASRAQGAQVLLGGEAAPGPGFFYPPTILADVPPGSPAAIDELFGPVAAVFRVPDREAALAVANASVFGLGASVWTRDAAQADAFIRDLDAGMVFVNDMVVSDARLPFGGIKQSGLGRELGPTGFREFTNQKSVRILRLPVGPR